MAARMRRWRRSGGATERRVVLSQVEFRLGERMRWLVVGVGLVLASSANGQESGARGQESRVTNRESRDRLANDDSVRLAAALSPRVAQAIRIRGAAPAIDGDLSDSAWAEAPVQTDFVEQSPRPGLRPKLRTEFQVAYDDEAIYFAVRARDQAPETVVAPYPRRDDETRSDWIFVEIDSRHDRRTGYGFGLNPRGVQVDATFDAFINYDYAWDGVWQGAARIDSTGWCAEYRIPFSQLTYAANPGDSMAFGLNVYRLGIKEGESSTWSPRLPTYADLESHFNTIGGLVAPSRVASRELTPYFAAKGTATPANGNPLIDPTAGDGYAGADLRLRLGGGFTANATVHPDFGQVEADPSQINLTTFETFFAEQRPFFVEGSSQFAFDLSLPFATRGNSFGNEQPFYSRRIGGAPEGSVPSDAAYSDVPTSTTILGAAKVSGRTSNGWSAGGMAAVTDAAEGEYVTGQDGRTAGRQVVVEPTTGFGVLRVSRESGDGGRAVGLIATGVTRPGMDSTLADQRLSSAFSLGLDGRRRFSDDNYEVSAFAVGSHINGSAAAMTGVLHGPGHFFQRPDAPYLHDDTTRTSISGLAAQARIAKIGGAWHWAAIGHLITPGFEINDLGFQRNADWLMAVGSVSYQKYRPGHFIRRWSAGLDQVGAGWNFAGERRAALVSGFANASLRNYWGVTFGAQHEFPALATDVLRGGPALLMPANWSAVASVTTSYRKPFQLTLWGNLTSEPGSESHSWDIAPTVTWRATDRLNLSLGPEFNHTIYGWQYVTTAGEAGGAPLHYVMGRLDQSTVSLIARADFAFSSRMTLQLYMQPFLSAGQYTDLKEVRNPRADRPEDRLYRYPSDQVSYIAASNSYLVDTDGDGTSDISFANPDFNQQAFNLNAVWRWEYRPGSTIYLVWTQRRGVEGADGSFDFNRDWKALFAGQATNVLMLKVSYRLAF